ncbi:MAG TPA: NINE protein [Candidatus Limnocylindrales bacterium]|nr:NINE protein [Candidatus Limnocylindrales bacterium]
MSEQPVCPYCRMSFDQEGLVKIYCTGCGMPHHEDCYQENGGCTVFGCSKMPADDPKVQVSAGDLNAAAVAMQPGYAVHASSQAPLIHGQPGAPAYAQPLAGFVHPPKSRASFILLGIFLGAFGAHNFYAGYTGRAVGQLCLTLLSLFYLALVSWIWAVVEICITDKDSVGVPFS